MKVEVAVLGSSSLISLTVSVGVKLHEEVAQFTKQYFLLQVLTHTQFD